MRSHILLIILLSTVALWPFFKPGFFTTHDGEWMVVRFSAFHQALTSGQIPVRFTERLNNNYGYPVLNFLYPLPFYISEIPKLVGFNFQNSVKITFIFSSILSSIFMYLALKEKFSKTASLAGGVVYLFAPYRMVDLYVRGSLGENLAFMFLPLILLSIFKIAKNKTIYRPVLSVFFACLILSHNVIALFFVPFFILAAFILMGKKFKIAILYFILGGLAASFFTIPAIHDLKYVRLSQINVADAVDHLVPPSKLLISPWNYGPSPSSSDGFSPQIGILSALIFSLSVILNLRGKINRKVLLAQALFIGCLVMILPISKHFWNLQLLNNSVQYPWRLLAVIVFITAILTAYVLSKFQKQTLFAPLVIIFSIVSVLPYIRPQEFVTRADGYYSTNESTTTIRDEYLPIWAKSDLQRVYSKILPGTYSTSSEIIDHANYSFLATSEGDENLKVATVYYPGFVASIDGLKTPITNDHDGLIQVKLPRGEHKVIIKYSKTPVQVASELLSLLALMTIGTLFFNEWRKTKSS